MKYLRFRNWERYQHYRDRSPVWIKLYCSILDDGDDWQKLTDAECGVLAKMLAWASRMGNAIPCNPEIIAEEINADSPINIEKYAAIGVVEILASRQECVAAERVRVESLKSDSKSDSSNASKSASKSASLRGERGDGRNSDGKEETKNPPTPRKRGAPSVEVCVIVEHLNKTTGKRFAADRATTEIERCLKAGATQAECIEVIDHLWRKWGGNPKMVDHLNKTTPFRKSHFEAYLDEARAGRVTAAAAPANEPIPREVFANLELEVADGADIEAWLARQRPAWIPALRERASRMPGAGR